MNELTILKPTDCHIHLRDGAHLHRTVADASHQFCQAVVMPNLVPPVIDLKGLSTYQDNILIHLEEGQKFTPLMTLYLHESQNPNLFVEAKKHGVIGVKMYPKNATTNSQSGVQNIEQFYPIFETLATIEMPLLIHGEVTDHDIDIFDREQVFIDRVLSKIVKEFPDLKVVLEHITTKNAVDFVGEQKENIAATITPHHLVLNRNDLLVGGVHPHYYCLPILKRSQHQQALIQAAISGSPHFFLGTDSAPHIISNKESACGCAGIYNAHCAIELYATVFEQYGALEKLENFASVFGPKFYELPPTTTTITLEKKPWTVPKTLPFGENNSVVPIFAGEELPWSLKTTI